MHNNYFRCSLDLVASFCVDFIRGKPLTKPRLSYLAIFLITHKTSFFAVKHETPVVMQGL